MLMFLITNQHLLLWGILELYFLFYLISDYFIVSFYCIQKRNHSPGFARRITWLEECIFVVLRHFSGQCSNEFIMKCVFGIDISGIRCMFNMHACYHHPDFLRDVPAPLFMSHAAAEADAAMRCANSARTRIGTTWLRDLRCCRR